MRVTHQRMKRFLLPLTVVLLWGCFILPVSALTYRGFVDVSEDTWFSAPVIQLNDAGIVPYGFSRAYKPDEPITTAEFAYVLLHSQNIWVRTAQSGESWTTPHLEALSGLLGYDVPLEPATRDFAAAALVSILNLPVCDEDAMSPFSDTDNANAAAVFEAGIMSGELRGNERFFSGEAALTRAQLAVIGVELLSFSNDAGQKDSELLSPVYDDISYLGACIPANTPLPQGPQTTTEFRQLFEYMMVQNLNQIEVTYQGITAAELNEVKETLQSTFRQFRYERSEYYSYFEKASFKTSPCAEGGYTLTFCFNAPQGDIESAKTYRSGAFLAASHLLDALYETGQLTIDMAERERAKVLTEWVATHTRYTNNGRRLDHTAWSVLSEGTGVCDGYASALQILLSLDNIQCWGQYGRVKSSGIAHQWTMAILDGRLVGIDATFYRLDRSYFGMSQAQLDKRYILIF